MWKLLLQYIKPSNSKKEGDLLFIKEVGKMIKSRKPCFSNSELNRAIEWYFGETPDDLLATTTENHIIFIHDSRLIVLRKVLNHYSIDVDISTERLLDHISELYRKIEELENKLLEDREVRK